MGGGSGSGGGGGGGNRRGPPSPGDYLRASIELHLSSRIVDPASKEAIGRFLSGGGGGGDGAGGGGGAGGDGGVGGVGGGGGACPRLFAWVPRKKAAGEAAGQGDAEGDDDDEGWDEALASTDALDGRNLGAVAFVNASLVAGGGAGGGGGGGEIKSARQIQCMVVSPRVYPEDEDDDEGGEEGKEGGKEGEEKGDAAAAGGPANPGATTFLALQLYARHCFVPAVRAAEALEEEDEESKEGGETPDGDGGALAAGGGGGGGGRAQAAAAKSKGTHSHLEDRLRELDVALGQCRRASASRIPRVTLRPHPVVAAAAAALGDGKIDLDASGLSSKLDDDAFLNEVQGSVNHWIHQIRKVTSLPSSTPFPSSGDSAESTERHADLEEISFWIGLNDALAHVRAELSRPDVRLTIALLNAAKRFVATVALENNTGLDAAEDRTSDVVGFLREYPAPLLAAARDWTKIGAAIDATFDHLPKVRQSRHYDLDRLARLVEATTLALRERMEGTLRDAHGPNGVILGLSYDEYETIVRIPTQDVFVSFDARYEKFGEFFLDQGRMRRRAGGEGGRMGHETPAKVWEGIILYHAALRERLDAIHRFRTEHERLRGVVAEVLTGEDEEDGGGTSSGLAAVRANSGAGGTPGEGPEGGTGGTTTGEGGDRGARENASRALREVEEAPSLLFASVDVLDLTERGNRAFASALDGYDRRVDAVEERLARLLRDRLSACRDAEDMFRVFARFNPLLARTRVRAAVKEFQLQLIDTVGKAVQKLQSKFAMRYESSPASAAARVRGVPPVSGKILWARQMERRVRALMRRMGDVLGKEWGQQLEGRRLRRSCDELLGKLDSRPYFRSWVDEWERELGSDAGSRLATYPVVVVREGGTLVAKANFDERREYLSREVRYLKWLGYERDIPRTIALVAEEAVARYPHAMALKTALRSYAAARGLVTPELEPLVAQELGTIKDAIAEAFDASPGKSKPTTRRRIRWDSKDLPNWVAVLNEHVSRFEERVEILLRACDNVDGALQALGSVEYEKKQFVEAVENVQKVVDELSLAGYSDLASWAGKVNDRMGVVLGGRLEEALRAWIETFELSDGDSAAGSSKKGKKGSVRVPKIAIEIQLRNQEISAHPAVPTVRSKFLDELHDYMGIVCTLPRLNSRRFEVFESGPVEGGASDTFHELADTVSAEVMADAYFSVECHMKNLSAFVDEWLGYQALWDNQVADVAAGAGSDLKNWHDLILDVSNTRATLDSTSTAAEFGPIVVRYNKVQSQVNLKYDSWQKELQTYFAAVLAERIHENHEKVANAKTRLEGISLEGSSAATSEIVLGVTFLQEVTQQLPSWERRMKELADSEKLLRRQRHTFRGDWVEASLVGGQLQQVEQLLAKRNRTMQEQVPLLRSRIVAEDKANSQRVADLVGDWEQNKPLMGNVAPDQALETLTKFEFNMKKAQLDQENLVKAKDALGLEVGAMSTEISGCLDEVSDLTEVWEAVSKPYGSLVELKDTLWATAVTRKVRKTLDDLLIELRSLPNRIRQYDAYTALYDKIKGFLSGHSSLSDLKTDALKDRHWKTILQRLGIRVPFSELTVGMLWDNGVLERKKDMAEILSVAQGEMAIEIFLTEVRDRWMKQELDLVLYQNRVRLIRGWDDLFTALDDHTGGLVLMRSSPYYRAVREFQEDGNLWEDRLTKLRAAFDAWIDVQRRWVYLEGIFFGSADIKAQLPAEWSRFKNVDGEFITLMRRIASRPYAMEALNIDNLQRTLERLANLMTVIQKALGAYLEKQRSDLSRFYFLGDDDLLEIIGNSSEPGKVLPHLGKMFASIATCNSVPCEEEGVLTKFDAMISKDGEKVPFDDPIMVTKKKNVKEWLKELENGMSATLAKLLNTAVTEVQSAQSTASPEGKADFVGWAGKFPAQVMILASLVNWSMSMDAALRTEDSKQELESVLDAINGKLEVMAETVLRDLPTESRKKFEQLITELVHQRDVTRSMIDGGVSDVDDFRWLYHLRFDFNPHAENLVEKLRISLSNASFYYGFEYLGIGERLVQTPLTDRCYLTLTQALHFRMGGNPFGPAGTGKTESVKALGAQLGRFVVVMNCDEAFDFGAMGRIFCGLCQVGAWGCFDEFNRLEERILSAVSQQILTIQHGLIERQKQIELLGKSITLSPNVGIFVTMNPGYAGRSNLPDNLKTLFRSVAMVVPDRKLIAQVMLYSQGIVSAEKLAGRVVDLFIMSQKQMSKQSHYDFGLRALKTLLVSAGGLKRKAIMDSEVAGDELADLERKVLIQGACNNILPKLVAEDIDVFSSILEDVFPGSQVSKMEDATLKDKLDEICRGYCYTPADQWVQKILQLKMVIEMRHGIMIVGPSGVGKTSALRTLKAIYEAEDGVKNELYTIDPKAVDKEGLYGSLDGTTLEWTDGIFTSLLRTILANQRGEADRKHWIVFDGDVDPEWAENLNSVLDDNKLLTLPSGERLSIPDNVRIIPEVDSLEQANEIEPRHFQISPKKTPATVSRCGMIWFSADTISSEMVLASLLGELRTENVAGDGNLSGDAVPSAQVSFVDAIEGMVISDDPRSPSLVAETLEFALSKSHIMDMSREGLLKSLKSLLVKGICLAIEYDEGHPDFPIVGQHMDNFAKRWLLHSLLWSFAGSASWEVRSELADLLLRLSGMMLDSGTLADYRVRVENGEWELWSDSVPRMEIESHKVTATDVVVTTTDTVRHSDILGAWLESRSPLIFTYVRKGKDVVLEPAESLGSSSWLVVFCDEINLPEEDSYGTQRVIMFMRQLVEHGGFWREDNVWVKTNRIQFVGACNPPTDAGRVDMSPRFLRHASLLLVDFPSRDSLTQIYRTFNGGIMKLFPHLKGETEVITEAMIELFTSCQKKFTPDQQPQYFYSPRELSRWVRGIYEAVVHMDQGLTREELIRIWAHEALRLFSDRLVEEEEISWCSDQIDKVAREFFAAVDHDQVLERPLFYSSWLTKDTRRVNRDELQTFLQARLKVFYEEELDVPLVVFDQVLDHVLRIDRVLRQPMGHLLLVGDSGAGKTVLSKFVSWMNGLQIFQIKAHSRYGIDDFNEDLRGVMRRVGVDGEKICFIFDEGNVLGSGFLEAMNALLASGEVPGLFDGDDYTALMSACRDSAARDGVIIDQEEELWRRFTGIVQRNLHVVFTMNPSGGEWKNRSTTSPALFNRCVVDWFGSWSPKAMAEVGREFTLRLDMGDAESAGGSWGIGEGESLMVRVEDAFEGIAKGGFHQAVVAALVQLHTTTKAVSEEAASSASSTSRTFLSPRDYLALIHNFVTCVTESREQIEEEQLHVNAGLSKLRQTQENVAELKTGLAAKTIELREKETLANAKLQQMVADQNEAQKRKEEAEKMSVEVERQQGQISQRKEKAQSELDEAEPALNSAKNSVKGIKKRDLDEIRNLGRPPVNVKLTLECVAIMLGQKSVEWTDVRKLLAKPEFIPSILSFDVDKLTNRQIKTVNDKYLEGNPDLSVEKVTRSSKAAGPLYQWASSQVKYSLIYNSIQPLREEVAALEKDAAVANDQKDRLESEVCALESSIANYKSEYANLIRDVEDLKREMEVVTTKVERAESLMKSLSQESERWSKSSEGFEAILRNLIGDGLQMAAFLTYSGFFNFNTRRLLLGQ
ncbi:hypothetical protein ACHAWF_018608 [Thalassiosira exigua]